MVGEPGQEGFNGVLRVQFLRMLQPMEANESPAPVDIGLLGPPAAMQKPDALAQLTQQAGGPQRRQLRSQHGRFPPWGD